MNATLKYQLLQIKITLGLLLAFTCCFAWGQESYLKKVTIEDVINITYVNDTFARAVILYKYRLTYFENKEIDKWEVVTEIYKRVKILKQEGLQYGVEKIKLSKDKEKRESIADVKGTVYSNEKGRLKSNKLKKENILENNLSVTDYEIIINPPNLKVGSIIDIKYKITSPFYKINDLLIQEEIPVKRYVANIKIPSFFDFRRILLGNPKLTINEHEQFRDVKVLSKNKHFENAVGGGFKKVEKESILQVKESVVEYEMDNVPGFKIRDKKDKESSRFKIIYELLSVNIER